MSASSYISKLEKHGIDFDFSSEFTNGISEVVVELTYKGTPIGSSRGLTLDEALANILAKLAFDVAENKILMESQDVIYKHDENGV